MFSILLLITIIAVVSYILVDLIPVYRDKQWGVFWFYSAAMAFVLFIAICISQDIKLPSPAITLKKVISAIFGLE